MISDAFLSFIYWIFYLLTTPLRAAADVSFPAALNSGISLASGYLTAVNEFLPVMTILSVLGAVFTIEASVFIYKCIMWVLKRFPTQS